jgi:hypothetical protein
MRWDEEWKKLKLRDASVTPRNMQELQASKLGDAPDAPLLHRQKLGHLSRHYIFYSFIFYAFFFERQLFLFSVFFCFGCCNKCLYHIMFLERDLLHFSFGKNTLFFTLIVQRVFSFSWTAFSFRFSRWFLFRSCYIFASRCI